jgi:hypothetical protein
MLCFHGRAFCNKIIVDFHLLGVLLYMFSTREGKLHTHALLTHVHSSFSITSSFSLTMTNRKRIPSVFVFWRQQAQHIHTVCPWWSTAVYWLHLGMLSSSMEAQINNLHTWLCLGMLRQQADRHIAKISTNKQRTPIFGWLFLKYVGYLRKYSILIFSEYSSNWAQNRIETSTKIFKQNPFTLSLLNTKEWLTYGFQ